MPHDRVNALGACASPYLLQHARNPVEWKPWGEAAFAEARVRDVPIFLSIGYSTCYWCHVMERECFEDAAIAALLNDSFVCIKVDREERPDVDDLYMAATLIMNGHGGWPMTVFVEPRSLRPFYCGTYFPARSRSGLPGRPDLARVMRDAWRTQRTQVEAQAEAVASAVREQTRAPAPAPLGPHVVEKGVSAILAMFDRARGGFGQAPKFPQPCLIDLLLEAREGAADKPTARALDEAVRRTLDRMAIGGLFDQVAGGFHRYCVDADWSVPHFEKMLYDNALLAGLYARAGARYGDAWFVDIAKRTADYMLRELGVSGGGLAGALDAETNGREGLTYVWTPADLTRALVAADTSEADISWAMETYGLARGPNFRDPHHADAPACNVPRLSDRPDALARAQGVDASDFNCRLDRINRALAAGRASRPQPARDDTTITSWNALGVIALCEVARASGEPSYLARAQVLGTYLYERLVGPDGLPRRSRRGGALGPVGTLEDAGALAWALARLGRDIPSQQAYWRDAARRMIECTCVAFADSDGSLLDARPDAAPELFLPARSFHDGAMPSGHAMLLRACIELAEGSADVADREQAVRVLAEMSGAIAGAPASSPWGVLGLLRMLRAGWVRGPSSEPHSEPSQSPAPPPVEVWAGVERVTVMPDTPALVPILLRIAPGHHVIAGDPGDGGEPYEPLRVGVINGTGVQAFVDYPSGAGSAPGPRSYEGTVEMTIVLERQGEWSGRPLLALRYQACTSDSCLAPVTVELDVALDPG
ncbi:MAG: thioredoxin domain-containing protein [Phycisphaerales bacterium]|nr:thioredoxin domain-containing protein [Phycisphaerales bacterium]